MAFVPYRTEWRYGIFSHRGSLVDMGHVGENLYLACSALNLGTCGIGAYDQNLCDTLFDLDGEEEYIIYTETVGTIRAERQRRGKGLLQIRGRGGLVIRRQHGRHHRFG